MFDLTGKVALVTGGNRGIGFAMAEALAAHGADIAIWGSNADRNAQALEKLSEFPVRVSARTVNVANEAEVVAGMNTLSDEFGRVDTIIANAGVGGKLERFTESTTENMRDILGVNLDGVYWTLREGCRLMVERAKAGEPGGSLIGVASLGAVFGMARAEIYSASKAAIAALMRSLAVEHGPHGIRANTVAPGFIATDMNPHLDTDMPTTRILPRIPLKRWGKGTDFGGIAVYLASDASAYHTGGFFLIDGGFAVR
ncbi:SDR family NAD(P)-dependent oxidoreductase [Novosphingobium sp. HII-3]|uniref:SDR family NAD(P)-dependent oxidoreductase n=1 Tax=Novosphingobium sp. HII-3 TaxID=2075565 RepID=UPI000CD9FF3F|nr:SDR family oxidoreductase [Novosphingobium sp. HII-3]